MTFSLRKWAIYYNNINFKQIDEISNHSKGGDYCSEN